MAAMPSTSRPRLQASSLRGWRLPSRSLRARRNRASLARLKLRSERASDLWGRVISHFFDEMVQIKKVAAEVRDLLVNLAKRQDDVLEGRLRGNCDRHVTPVPRRGSGASHAGARSRRRPTGTSSVYRSSAVSTKKQSAKGKR